MLVHLHRTWFRWWFASNFTFPTIVNNSIYASDSDGISFCSATYRQLWLITSTSTSTNKKAKLSSIFYYYYNYNHFMTPWTLSGITRVSRYQKGKNEEGKTNLDLLEQEIVSDSGISWAICKFAPRPRQVIMPASHHSVFYRPDTLPTAQPTVSKHCLPSKTVFS